MKIYINGSYEHRFEDNIYIGGYIDGSLVDTKFHGINTSGEELRFIKGERLKDEQLQVLESFGFSIEQ